MSLSKTFDRIKYIDDLIRRKATGDLETLARKLHLSKSHTHRLLTELKELNFPIKYSRDMNTYYYAHEGEFIQSLFSGELSNDSMRRIKGGENNYKLFLHSHYMRTRFWNFAK